MGVTVHYEGLARSEDDLEAVLALVRSEAARAGWPAVDLSTADGVLQRVVDEEERDYRGRVRGLVVQPHPECEPLHFLFGDDRFMQSYCKTQFAGVATHVAVVTLLRRIAPHFAELTVLDEGAFWESNDAESLQSHLDGFDRALADLIAENPGARTKVRLPSGRIIDALT
jgi:hypothetical protein